MVKPRLGIAGRVLFNANCQGVPIRTQPFKERKIKEHNTGMTKTRAARVMRTSIQLLHPQPLLLYILDQLLELVHAN